MSQAKLHMPPNLTWTVQQEVLSTTGAWSLVFSINRTTHSILNRGWAEHLRGPNVVCRLGADSEGGWGAAWRSWVHLPSLSATVAAQGHMLGLRRDPRNTHFRALNISTWQLPVNARHHTHACKNTSKEVKMEVHFLWIESHFSLELHQRQHCLSCLFFRNPTEVVSEAFPQPATADSPCSMCSSCWL